MCSAVVRGALWGFKEGIMGLLGGGGYGVSPFSLSCFINLLSRRMPVIYDYTKLLF
jgi:hypothetical protein